MKLGGVIGGVWCLAACASNVSQDRSTGPDGEIRGALPLRLTAVPDTDRDTARGTARGIVTYPGGDRVDWKVIELPRKLVGELDLQLSWTTPRPDLQVAFEVFDEHNVPVTRAKMERGSRSAFIRGAKGKYFVRIYAPRRIDAGAYKLHATFTGYYICILEEKPRLEIDEPPPLPAVPTDEP